MPNETDTNPVHETQVELTNVIRSLQEAKRSLMEAQNDGCDWAFTHYAQQAFIDLFNAEARLRLAQTKDMPKAIEARKAWELENGYHSNHGRPRLDPPYGGRVMTYDIRDTMVEAIKDDLWRQVKLSHKGSFIQDRQETKVDYQGDIVYGDLADACLSVIANHLANEPRTKAETALIEFAEGKARAMRDNDLLRASDRAIPREILLAFAEELK